MSNKQPKRRANLKLTPSSLTRREFLAAGTALTAYGVCGAAAPTTAPNADAIIGPLVGHTDQTSAMLWARFPKPGSYSLTLRPATGSGEATNATAKASAETDGTATWTVRGLSPATKYTVDLPDGRPCSFTTPPANDTPTKVTIAMGSCGLEDAGTRAVWSRMAAENPDAVILAGDTPYIDSTDLTVQRNRHRAFAAVPEYQALLSTRPFWSTWDDHDFGRNDADGNLRGKENSRQAFTEYRASRNTATAKAGFTPRSVGVRSETFLIDARWWSYTGPSFADPTKKTLLGQGQWDWLKASLAASTAPFKVLAVGCVWEDKKNKEKDHWETYVHERDALFQFIREKRISGVVLMGGDIHVTRLLKYPPKYVGYPLYDFISSPMHARTIPSLNVPHPYLLNSKVQANTFMTLTADTTVQPPTLTARFLDTSGKSLFADTVVQVDELASASA